MSSFWGYWQKLYTRNNETNLERYKKGFNAKKEKYKNKVLSKLEEGAFSEETNELINKEYNNFLETI